MLGEAARPNGADESPPPELGREQTRAGGVQYDINNKCFVFRFDDEGSSKKITVSAKSGRDIDELARIMILLIKRCERGASHSDVVQYRQELVATDTSGLEALEKVETVDLAVRFTDGAISVVGEKYDLPKPGSMAKKKSQGPKPAQKCSRLRCGGIKYDTCNRLLFIEYRPTPDSKLKKITIKAAKSGATVARAKMEICLIASKCHEGASVDELLSYKEEVVKMDGPVLESTLATALAPLDMSVDEMFQDGAIAKAEAAEANQASGNQLKERDVNAEAKPSTKRKRDEGDLTTTVPATSSKERHSKRSQADPDVNENDRVKEAGRKGELEHALVIKGRDASKKHSVVNGVYVPIPEGFDGAKAFKNISVDVPRVIFYHSSKGRWKIAEEVGHSKYFAYLADPDAKGVPLTANDGSRAWYFFNSKGEGYVQDPGVQSSFWKPRNDTPAKAAAVDVDVAGDDTPPKDIAVAVNVPADAESNDDSSDSGSQSGSGDEGSTNSRSSDSSEEKAAGKDPTIVVSATPKGNVCAKMLVTSGLRCACHFAYARECPARLSR